MTGEPPRENVRSEGEPSELVELALLLPRWQVQALEAIAHQNGITTARMVRSFLEDCVAQQPQATELPDSAFSKDLPSTS